MLIIDGNSVYEIDEECARKKKVPKECGIYEKMMQQQNREIRLTYKNVSSITGRDVFLYKSYRAAGISDRHFRTDDLTSRNHIHCFRRIHHSRREAG